MSAPTPAVPNTTAKPGPFETYVKPFLTPYYFTVAGVLGGITVVLAVVTLLLIIVVANFNILGVIE